MKKLVILFLCILSLDSRSQTGTYLSVDKAEHIPWERIDPAAKRFVIAGEAHQVSCIYPFQLSQLKYLVTKGFRHLVWEVPYSYAIITQRYLLTGNDSLMKYFVHTKEGLDYWKGVYQINQSLPAEDRLHIWGIDFELGDNAGEQYRMSIFKKALELLIEGKGDMPAALRKSILSIQTANTVKAVTDIKHQLKQMQHDPEVASYFGADLPHFRILVNRWDFFKANRNDEMLEAFKEICSTFHLDSSARYLGRFGWGHTDKSFKRSIAWLLENDPNSPVRKNTFVVGVHYLNCTALTRSNGSMENDGIVNDRTQKNQLAEIDSKDHSAIKIFTWPASEKKKGWAKEADVLFVFSGYPGVTPLSSRP